MKEIRIKITDDEYEVLKETAEDLSERLFKTYHEIHKITPNRIVQQFISDLTQSENSSGSDERNLAVNWYYRSYYNF